MDIFIKRRKVFYIVTLLVIIIGLGSLVTRGLNLGIDFTGGSIVQVQMESSAQSSQVKNALLAIGMEQVDVSKRGKQFLIRTTELDQKQTRELLDALESKFNNVEFLSAESVGASIGKELTNKSILSVIVAALAMLVYISLRFEWSFGIAAIVSEIHDVLFVLGLFSIFQWEVNTSFIAAILTVVGFSINDTIVIFDRIRENLRMKRKEDYASLVNRSIVQSLNRSINTVLTALFPLVALLVFGGGNIRYFILAMVIGFVAGVYSSIFIASPVWYDIKNRA